MADAALARREARRKRILENSHNRLQLISNITNDDCCKEPPVKNNITPIPEQNNEIAATAIESRPSREIFYNGVTNNEAVSYEPLSDINAQNVFFGFNCVAPLIKSNIDKVFHTSATSIV